MANCNIVNVDVDRRSVGLYGFDMTNALTIFGKAWIDGDSNPPSIELLLSDGTYVRIGWDIDYNCRLLWWSPDGETDFVPCTADRIALHPDVLFALVTEAKQAVEEYDAKQRREYLADPMSYADFW